MNRTIALTKRGWVAAIIAAQANPVCGHIVCGRRETCALVKP